MVSETGRAFLKPSRGKDGGMEGFRVQVSEVVMGWKDRGE